ncbi:MAG: superoxide dismutase family protein [Paenibacillaceae bacterium]
MRRYVSFVCLIAIVCMLSACGAKEAAVQAAAESTSIKTSMINTKGVKIGTAELSTVTEGVKIHLEAAKLTPGLHGIHFHEVGLCEKPDFATSGMHFNPFQKQHGFDNPQGYHAGDLPNIQVEPDGKVNVDLITKSVTLENGKSNSLLTAPGVSLIIHEKSDDYMTDPSGNSGARIACGVIK